mmetsp:Transcript_68889/g.164364  ORF Transcript_68889/g.164364 Transcript_68889/m.164364 type:complete len:201 (-) Transcript_68889:339-941(-)
MIWRTPTECRSACTRRAGLSTSGRTTRTQRGRWSGCGRQRPSCSCSARTPCATCRRSPSATPSTTWENTCTRRRCRSLTRRTCFRRRQNLNTRPWTVQNHLLPRCPQGQRTRFELSAACPSALRSRRPARVVCRQRVPGQAPAPATPSCPKATTARSTPRPNAGSRAPSRTGTSRRRRWSGRPASTPSTAISPTASLPRL